MCLAIYTNGWAEGRSKCISVYVHLMQGDFDDKLEWPFQGDVHVQLLSWEEGTRVEGSKESTHTRVIPFDESAQECTTAGRIVGRDRAELCKFSSHQEVKFEKWLPENTCIQDTAAVIFISQTACGNFVLNNITYNLTIIKYTYLVLYVVCHIKAACACWETTPCRAKFHLPDLLTRLCSTSIQRYMMNILSVRYHSYVHVLKVA